MRVAITLVVVPSAGFADAADVLVADVLVADVLVSMRGVANDCGEIVVGICSADVFIGGTCAYRGTAPARPETVPVVVAGVVPGTYTVCAYHDENGNHHIDCNLLGVPRRAMVSETASASCLARRSSPMPRSR